MKITVTATRTVGSQATTITVTGEEESTADSSSARARQDAKDLRSLVVEELNRACDQVLTGVP